MLDIQPYVLQYWQTEFPALAAKKSAESLQQYGAGDLEIVRRIRELLYDEGHTITSAKNELGAELEGGGVRGKPPAATEASEGAEALPAEAELPANDGQPDDPETATAAVEAPRTAAAPDAAAVDAPGDGEIGTLTQRVERLEAGVAALVSQARQLAAELSPEMGIEED